MGDFEFDIELLISLVETRPLLRDKTDDIYKDRIETNKQTNKQKKKHGEKFVLVLRKTS
jgi:hypothetical protein